MKRTIDFNIAGIRGQAHGGAIKLGEGAIGDVEKLKELLGRFGSKGEGRGNVVMVRLSDDALARIDQLVEATLFGSRSEAAAYLLGAGIESQQQLFDRLGTLTGEIRKLKDQLRKVALDTLKSKK
jgi:Arc/MetJ-type ribon-helix-helix transcriptional regulator